MPVPFLLIYWRMPHFQAIKSEAFHVPQTVLT